ncbi:MAG: hypothetical protein NDJ89_11195 [Oligoflexia bacterium]|nr:hypothetical protein [Oligoflexia bacterium]
MPLTFALVKTPSFSVQAEADIAASELRLRFSGSLDENADLRKVQSYCEGQKESVKALRVDLGEIRYLNSPGVRAWIQFLGRVQSFFHGCFFERLSENFLHSASSYSEMLGFSFNLLGLCEIPFYCAGCAERTTEWVEAAELGTLEELRLPARACGKCQAPLRLDDFERQFFRFLSRSPR